LWFPRVVFPNHAKLAEDQSRKSAGIAGFCFGLGGFDMDDEKLKKDVEPTWILELTEHKTSCGYPKTACRCPVALPEWLQIKRQKSAPL
jgi:hypothetical protein